MRGAGLNQLFDRFPAEVPLMMQFVDLNLNAFFFSFKELAFEKVF